MKVLTAFFQIMVLFSVSIALTSQSPTTPPRTSPIAVGEIAPDFNLEDQNKKKVSLSVARGESPAVLVFYRGYW